MLSKRISVFLVSLSLLNAPGRVAAQEIVDTGRVRILKGGAYGLAFGSDGKRLFSAGSSEIQVWDLAAGKELQVLKGHAQLVVGLAVNRDGSRLISGGWDASHKVGAPCLRIWDLPKQTSTSIWTGDALVHSVALSPDERYFATGGREKVLKIWDFPSGKLRVAVEAHPRDIQSVAFSPDSKMLASCGYDSEIKVWFAETGKPIRAIANAPRQAHWDTVEFSPDGLHLAAAGAGLCVVDVDSGKEIFNIPTFELQTLGLSWSPDSKLIATGGYGRRLEIWEAATGKKLASLAGHKDALRVVRFSPDGRWIATGAFNDPDIRLWPLVTPAAPPSK